MSRRLATAVVAVALTVAAAACDLVPSPSPTGGGMVDATGSWILTSGTLDGADVPIVPGSAPTMTVEGTSVSGSSACNGYGTGIVVADGAVRFAEWGSTAMLCEDSLMASEVAFTAAMQRVRAATRDGDALVLTGDGVELRFEPLDDVPTDAVIDRVWRLVALVEDGVERPPEGDVGTVTYHADGTFEGSTGCRTFTGRWTVANARIVATDLAMDQLDCPQALLPQDGHVTEVVGDASATIDGERLRLDGRFGLGLVYELAPEG